VTEKLVVKPIRLTETTWNAYKAIAERKGLSTGTYIRTVLIQNKDYQNELRKT
jgi:predicted DNA binding CopG/RHH family protein